MTKIKEVAMTRAERIMQATYKAFILAVKEEAPDMPMYGIFDVADKHLKVGGTVDFDMYAEFQRQEAIWIAAQRIAHAGIEQFLRPNQRAAKRHKNMTLGDFHEAMEIADILSDTEAR